LKLTFLGTRGEIEKRTRRHRRHSSLLVAYGGRKVMVDCGVDWLGALDRQAPNAIVVTHAHPDHAGGLTKGAPCPVYATGETWRVIGRYGIDDRRRIQPRRPLSIHRIALEAFPLEHSLRAPAVGFRITAGRRCIFYAPDVVAIRDAEEALADVDLFVGDGASITRGIVRRRDGARIGHASIRTQLDWCAAAGVERAIFTHCGSEIVTGDEEAVAAKVEALGRERRVRAEIAHDGLVVLLR
jgi:phosphoribosyl 1,2-cyclic phosphodiesterase